MSALRQALFVVCNYFMTPKLLTFLLLAILCCSCRTISFQQYFPLKNNETAIFTKKVDSINLTFTDTLVCREIIAKTTINSTSKKIFLSDALRDNYIINGKLNLYYFEKTILDSNSTIWMQDNSFANRLYCFKNGKLFVGYDWTKRMEYDTELELLFPRKLKQGFDYKHRNGDYWKSFRYIGKETVVINEVAYKDCLKMDIYETLGSSKKVGTVWFAKNIGIVKWDIKNEEVDYIQL